MKARVGVLLVLVSALGCHNGGGGADAGEGGPQEAAAPSATAAPARPPAGIGAIAFDAENAFLAPADRAALGFQILPDGEIGAVAEDGGKLVFFGPALSNAKCAGSPGTQGVYHFGEGTDKITTTYGCSSLLRNHQGGAARVAGGNVGFFDRDYVGGGPVLPVKSPDGTRTGLVMTYRAEFQWGPRCKAGPCGYGTLGLAFSADDGKSFKSLGEIVQPYVARADVIAEGQSHAIGTGPMAFGDAYAHAVDPRSADPAKTYLYVYFADHDPAAGGLCSRAQCLGVARALVADVAKAAFADDTAAAPKLFHKYHSGTWTEPAASGDPNDAAHSGHYTPLFDTPMREVAVLYDVTVNAFLVVHEAEGGALALHISNDLLSWPSPVARLEGPAGTPLAHPALVGETGDAAVGGNGPWLFYVSGQTLMNRQLRVNAR